MAADRLPILDLSKADQVGQKAELLEQLHSALFDVGFLYIKNHGVEASIISNLVELLPTLFDLPPKSKASLSKVNSPHFLGYSGYAEETTLGVKDLREQFDFATELPVIYQHDPALGEAEQAGLHDLRDFSKLYWRLRGPNQWPSESDVPGFRKAFTEYHDALQALSYRFVHLVEEAFGIAVGTFDAFFPPSVDDAWRLHKDSVTPQHRIKLIRYPPSPASGEGENCQGVGAHKDSSGWLTFLHQVGQEEGLEVLSANGTWIGAPPIDGTFVVNFGNAFEAATDGAVRATIHRVKAPTSTSNPRYSIPFFQGLPLDLTVTEIRSCIPESVSKLRLQAGKENNVANFLDPRWDNLGESQLRKWIRSHHNVARKWYGDEIVAYYIQ